VTRAADGALKTLSTNGSSRPSGCRPAPAGRGGAEGQSPGRVERKAGLAKTLKESPDSSGLVICAITGRPGHVPMIATATSSEPSTPAGQLWSPAFPAPELLADVAAMFPQAVEEARRAQLEGPRWEIVISPGAIQVRTKDWAKASRTDERAVERHGKNVDVLAGHVREFGSFPDDLPPSREITGWSRASRANMTRTLCQLDYSPLLADTTRLPAMLTLTYPGEWLVVAPNGRTVKAHMKVLRKRYLRAWGCDLVCVWKLEFQRRGAPHLHLLMVPPHGMSPDGRAFRQWISEAWAEIVGHPDPAEYHRHVLAGTGVDFAHGLRSRDPRRVAVYFTKHGALSAKAYQHVVPEPWRTAGNGPGRFWGYWGLRLARVGVHVLPQDGVTAGRILRRWARAQRTTREITRPRVDHTTGRVRYRKTRVRVSRLPSCRGWVSVNDGANFAEQLARALGAAYVSESDCAQQRPC